MKVQRGKCDIFCKNYTGDILLIPSIFLLLSRLAVFVALVAAASAYTDTGVCPTVTAVSNFDAEAVSRDSF